MYGILNCFTVTSTSYKNCFQYAGFPLIELIKENAFSFATNLSTVLLKILSAPAVSVPGLILCITKFVDERKWCCLNLYFIMLKNGQTYFKNLATLCNKGLNTYLTNNKIFFIWCTVKIKVQQPFIKVPSRIIGIFREEF